jgi:hypothetical protein
MYIYIFNGGVMNYHCYLLNPLAVGKVDKEGSGIFSIFIAVDIANCDTKTSISDTCFIVIYQSQYLSDKTTEKLLRSMSIK